MGYPLVSRKCLYLIIYVILIIKWSLRKCSVPNRTASIIFPILGGQEVSSVPIVAVSSFGKRTRAVMSVRVAIKRPVLPVARFFISPPNRYPFGSGRFGESLPKRTGQVQKVYKKCWDWEAIRPLRCGSISSEGSWSWTAGTN